MEHFRNLLVVRLAKPDAKETEAVGKGQLLDLPDQEIGDLRAQVADLSTETLLDYFDFMAVGDEEVNRSANPRFPLETVLVRLATLPKTLPVTQLLERLEKLEKKLPGAAPAAAGVEPPRETPQPFPVVTSAPPADGLYRWRTRIMYGKTSSPLSAGKKNFLRPIWNQPRRTNCRQDNSKSGSPSGTISTIFRIPIIYQS